ncbi:MAG TPA: radical SAM family heme chaperone HemW [Candidatus Gastranaerophilales bacterium]|nr:radical SAM family heme chaperone HemW [Candidatus Gastranaerophilales bacterium]
MGIKRPLNSIYIHIPFCKSKCHYCDFVSFAGKICSIDAYFTALEKEISFYLKDYKDKKFQTVYIGGGTPSLIDVNYYEKLLSNISFCENPEITIEMNPGGVSFEYLENLKKIGFNRLSIGVQSFDDDILKIINRPHNSYDAIKVVKDAQNAGFKNINIDLIYGLPQQTFLGWQKTLHQAIKLEINHISAYGLKIEEGTQFHSNPPQNLPDEDETVKMYLKTVELLENNGFNHYEISNFSQKSFESQHNTAYWNNEEYFGFGLAAHGYINSVRYSNKYNLDDYICDPLEKAKQNKLSAKEIVEEAIFLGLRLRKGINIVEFKQNYSFDLYENYKKIINDSISNGMMKFSGNRLKFTKQGMLLSNNILANFI